MFFGKSKLFIKNEKFYNSLIFLDFLKIYISCGIFKNKDFRIVTFFNLRFLVHTRYHEFLAEEALALDFSFLFSLIF